MAQAAAGPRAARELESHRDRCLPSVRSLPTFPSVLQSGGGYSRAINAGTIFSGKLPPASDKPVRWATELRVAQAEAIFLNEHAIKAAGQRHAKARARALAKVPSVPRLTEHAVRCAALAAEKRYQLPPTPLDEEERQISDIAHTALAAAWRERERLELRRREEQRQAAERTVYGAGYSVESSAYRRLRVEQLQRAHAEIGMDASGAWVAEASPTASGLGRAQPATTGPSSPPHNGTDGSVAVAAGASLASRQILAVVHGVTGAAAGAALASRLSPPASSSPSHAGPAAGDSMLSLRSSRSRALHDPFSNPNILELVRKAGRKYISAATRASIETMEREQWGRIRARDAAAAAQNEPWAAERKRAEVARWKSEQAAAAERELARRAEADESSCRDQAVARAARVALRNAPPIVGQWPQ
eukprot:scaffold8055_cov100-Isochrysis_galbana.AAC.2